MTINDFSTSLHILVTQATAAGISAPALIETLQSVENGLWRASAKNAGGSFTPHATTPIPAQESAP